MTRQVFFLHVPKTGGESVNRVLESSLGPGIVHAESYRASAFAELRADQYRFVSGHLTHYEARAVLGPQFHFVTVLRRPVEQLISHLGWALYLNEPLNESRLRKQSPEVQKLCIYLRAFDLSEASSFEQFIADIPDIGHLFFNNSQTRYILNRPNKLKYQKQDGELAAEDLAKFDRVGLFQRLDLFVESVGELAGCTLDLGSIEENALGNRYGIGRFETFESLIEPLVCADRILYEAAEALCQRSV